MTVVTIGALLIGAVLTHFGISALATLAHWVAVAGAFLVFTGLTYILIENDHMDFLPFESKFWEAMSAIPVSVAVGVMSYRLFEAMFATLGWGAALIAVLLVGVSIVSSPFLVANVVGGFIGGIWDVAGGE